MKKVLITLITTLGLSITAHANTASEFTGTWVEVTSKNKPHTLVITPVSNKRVKISEKNMYGNRVFEHSIKGVELNETIGRERVSYRLKGETLVGSGASDTRSYIRK